MSTDAVLPWPKYFTPERLYRLSVAQYHKMIEHGILTEDDRVELLEGFLVRRPPPSPAHTDTLRKTGEAITAALSRTFGEQTVEPTPVNDLLG